MDDFSLKRIKKAEKSIRAAERDLKAGDSDSATSHGYYAMFYIAEALLWTKDLRYSSHGGVHGGFGVHFAKTNELDPKFHKQLLRAFDSRILSDYGVDEGNMDKVAKTNLNQAKEFLKVVKDYLGKKT